MLSAPVLAFFLCALLIPQLIAFALLRRLRGCYWPRVASVIGAFLSTCIVVVAMARIGLGRPFEEAGSPEYGPLVLLTGAVIGVLNVGIALLLPRPAPASSGDTD